MVRALLRNSRERLELEDVSFVSDGFIPFRDNIDVAAKRGVRYIAEPGGSTRNAEVDAAGTENRIVSVSTGLRFFYHQPLDRGVASGRSMTVTRASTERRSANEGEERGIGVLRPSGQSQNAR